MEKLKDLYIFIGFLVGAGSVLLAAFQAWNDKPGSALVFAFIFALCGSFVFISQIKTLKVWEMQVELDQKLDQATQLTQRLQRLSAINAKFTYMQMAWGNRMGTPSAREKQAVLDEIDAQMKELAAKPDEVAAIKLPYTQMIALDFYFLYSSTLRAYAAQRYTLLNENAARDDSPDNNAMREAHSTTITAWTARTSNERPARTIKQSSLAKVLEDYTPAAGEWLNEQERRAAIDLKNYILKLNSECEKKGGYTTEAAEYYDNYHDHENALAEAVFGKALADLRR